MQIYVYINGTQHNLIEDILDNGTALFSDGELPIADSSYRFSEIMGDDNVVVNFSMPVFFEFPIGCRINVDLIEYTLLELGQVTKQNERWYDYMLTFESPAKSLSCYKFRNHVDGRLNFTLTAQPQEFLDHICRNMNMRENSNEWTVGDCIVSSEKTQSFSHNSVLDALNSIAQLFETEWEIIGKRISLRKLEYNKSNPLRLEYGKGNGFKSGITRQLSGEKAVDVLWVEGGDRNIDGRKYTYRKDGEVYHANKLRLPRDAQFVYIPSDGVPDASGKISQGTLFTQSEWDAMSDQEKAAYPDNMHVYTDADGFGVSRTTRINNGYEESIELSDIYPKKVLIVDEAVLVDHDKRFWDITATTADGSPIPNYNDGLIGGVNVTIIFNTGMLTGKEFNLANQGTENNPKCYDPVNRLFKIQPAEIDGITMPDLPTTEQGGTGYIPATGDEFAVFHISMPQSYITEAERELLLSACEYLYKHGEVEVEFDGTIDGIWAKNHWADIFPYLKIGGYVRFFDSQIIGNENGKLMRILSVKQYLNNPHSPEITLSNSSVSQGVSSEIKKIATNQVATNTLLDEQTQFTKRSFASAKQTAEMLEALIENYSDYFSESINPLTVKTMQLIVGNPDLQYVFGVATTIPESNKEKVTAFQTYTYAPTWANGTLTCAHVHIEHRTYTSAYGKISSGSVVCSYWDVTAATFTPQNSDSGYYLYIVAPKSAYTTDLGYLVSGATFFLTDTAQSHTETSFYFLCGILNAEEGGERSFASMNGFTEILGNQINTDRIVSADGGTYIDLDTGEIVSNHPIIFDYQGTPTDMAAAIGTALNDSADAIEAATAAENALNNLVVGGNNLLYNSADMTIGTDGVKSWRKSGSPTLSHKSTVDYSPTQGLIGTAVATNDSGAVSTGNWGFCQDHISVGIKTGQPYTLSYWVRGHLSFFKNIPSDINMTSGVTYTYDEYSDVYVITNGSVSTDTNVQLWLRDAISEANYLYLAGKTVKLSCNVTSSNVNNKPRINIYDYTANTSVVTKDPSQGYNEWEFEMPAIDAGHTVGIILRMHQYNKGGSISIGDTCTIEGLSLLHEGTYHFPQAIYVSGGGTISGSNTHIQLSHQWQRVVLSGILGGEQKTEYSCGYAYSHYMPDESWFEVCGMQLENSTVPSNWGENAEETAAKLEAAELSTRMAEASRLIACGYMMYRDPEFGKGTNGISAYNNSSNGSVTVTRRNDTLPNSTGKALRVVTNGTASPSCGGFSWAHDSRANAVYVYVIRCQIPVGYTLEFNTNATGTGATTEWATSQEGKGTSTTACETYICIRRCGSSGTFRTTGFFYLKNKAGYSATSVTWNICSATVYDCTAYDSLVSAFENGETAIQGGVVLTDLIQVRNANSDITAGVCGLNPNAAGRNPRFWAGGDYAAAVAAAGDSNQDIPSSSLPILLTDQGYNSNIGIFKVLDGAIAVMRDGQVVRISTDTYTNEKEYVPVAPVTRTLATGKQVTLTTSNYTGASTTWNIGTFPKTGSFDVTIPSIAIACSLSENRTMYTTGSVTCSLSVIIVVTAGSKSTTILNSSISVTNTATSGAVVGFTKTGTLNTTARTISKTRGTSGQNITLKMTVSTSVTGSGGAVSSESSYAKTNAALAVTVSQNQSCFVLADGGFACAQSSTKSLLFDAAAGTFDYNGSTFKINGRDFLNSKGQTVTTGSGYVQLSRIGQVVTCKLNIPKSSLSTSAIIPSGYRPTIAVEVVCTTGNSSTAYLVTVGSNGSITSAALPNNSVAYGVVTYVTADSYPS